MRNLPRRKLPQAAQAAQRVLVRAAEIRVPAAGPGMPEADPQEREAAEDQKTPGPVIEERKTETGPAIPAAAVQGEQAAGTDLRIQDHLQDPGEAKKREALREEGADSPAGEAPRTAEAAEREDKNCTSLPGNVC